MRRPGPLDAALLAAVLLGVPSLGALSPQAIDLRNRGIAQLENEQPAEAEAVFRRLAEQAPEDPLPWANLAIALLRQQRHPEALQAIDRALEKAPERGDLLTLRGEIQQWSGDGDGALGTLRRAAAAAPQDVEAQYALWRQASTLADAAAAAEATERLSRLRPDNLVVLLQQMQAALQAADRAAATKALLRVDELMWQAPPMVAQVMEPLRTALEDGDLEAARIPALRLENVLKVTPMYQQGLRELNPGIQGMPVERFRDEPPSDSFGEPAPVRFRGSRMDEGALAGRALAAGDFDGDQTSDLAWIAPSGLVVQRSAGPRLTQPAAAGFSGLLAADLDNDGWLDLVGHGAARLAVWKGGPGGAMAAATEELGLAGAGATAAAALDFDIEGDLDLALYDGRSGELFRNDLAGPLERVGARSLPALAAGAAVHDIAASDLDRDGDVDLLLATDQGLVWLDNRRQGTFADHTEAAGLAATGAGGYRAVTSADLDNDGWPDLAAAGRGLSLWANRQGHFEPWPAGGLSTSASFEAIAALDADLDGRLDLAVAGEQGLAILAQRDGGAFQPLPLDGAPAGAAALAAADLDGDGDLDLAAGGAAGLFRLDNEGGNRNRWLAVRLRGLNKGNSKNNVLGLGATLEVWSGAAYQFREMTGDVAHFGLGQQSAAGILRVVWTNGVPQNRLDVEAARSIVEEQVLKGSCPFLYTWDGERISFVTDLLWGAPIGLPVAPGVWAGADPSELVRVDGSVPRDGRYELRITEELWEAAFLDHLRLWVVDHPASVEVASNLRILPGRQLAERVLATRDVRPVAAARDAAGRDVTERVRARDEIYADGWEASPYQGVAARPWSFTFDLGEAPDGTEPRAVRLLLDGWIFPADASLNLAVAQRSDLVPHPPRLEVETSAGWKVLMAEMGFPAGKTKTMVVDTPPLPAGAHRLRVVSGQWLSWDRIAWSVAPADGEPQVRARLLPATAGLWFRGFSELVRLAPNAPHHYDYARVATQSPWLPFPGRYTRHGDVRDLLLEADDRSAILAPGDEIVLTFDASALPPTPAGWRRTVFLESHGWDKDADRNTGEGERLEPLPFRAMSRYPYGPGEAFPDTPRHRAYVQEWLTREVGDRR